MRPLSARDGLLECGEAVAVDPSLQSLPGLLLCGGTPVRRTEIHGDLVIGPIGRQRTVEVHPVAVDVDIVLVRTSQPRKAVRIEGMDVQSGDIVGERRALAPSQPLDLDSRAEKSLDAVCARDSDKHGACAARADPRRIGREIEIIGSSMVEGKRFYLGSCRSRTGPDLLPGLRVIAAEWAVHRVALPWPDLGE